MYSIISYKNPTTLEICDKFCYTKEQRDNIVNRLNAHNISFMEKKR